MSSNHSSPDSVKLTDAEANGFATSEEKDLDQNLEQLNGSKRRKPGTAGTASSAASERFRDTRDMHSLGTPYTPSQSLEGSMSMGGSVVKEGEQLGDEFEHYGNPPDEFKPARKPFNFEFTSNYGMYRVIRLILYIQMIALITDHDNMKIPVVFQVFCRTICYYSLHFYSRPFLDLIYICQKWLGDLPAYLAADWEISGEMPWEGMGGEESSEDTQRRLEKYEGLNFLDLRTWHTMKFFTHFFCSILFSVMAVLFTIRFWEIKDFTDRNELRVWIKSYVADGWYFRGGLHLFAVLFKSCSCVGFLLFMLYVVSRQFNSISLPNEIAVGAFFTIATSISVTMTVLGCFFITGAEKAFTRYVSQNVGYTSTMIIKRVVKAKLEIGIMFMFIVFMPALYTFVKGLIPVLDWNDTHAAPWRRKFVNYDVPCYFMAFPPFTDRMTQVSGFTCPYQFAISEDEPTRKAMHGFFRDSNIVPCDSYFGVLVFLVATICTVFLILSYNYFIWRMISEVEAHYKRSRWVKPLYVVQDLLRAERAVYNKEYPFHHRLLLAIRAEVIKQLRYIEEGVRALVNCLHYAVVSSISCALSPLYVVCMPCIFLGSRLFILFCNEYTKEGRQRILIQEMRKRQAEMALNMMDESDLQDENSGLHIEMENTQDRSFANEIEAAAANVKSNRQIMEEKLEDLEEKIFHSHDMLGDLKLKWKQFVEHVTDYFDFRAYYATINMYIGIVMRFICCQRQDSISFHQLPGGKLAEWRIEHLMSTKEKRLRDLQDQITREVSQSKLEFVTDHELQISLFDRVVDSGGIFLLICPYNFYKMKWTMVIFIEITIYAIAAASLNNVVTGYVRGGILCFINLVMMVLTYLYAPYTEEIDKWLDFLGRMMVFLTGVIICSLAYVNENTPEAFHVSMFAPVNPRTLNEVLSLHYSNPTHSLSALIVVYFYAYILNILISLGAFGYIRRKMESFTFGFHDHILNFLVFKADEKTLGCENMFTGLIFIQQWDDIIAQQRRLALLAWPDVRPTELVHFSNNLIELKWASLFNLTVKNLRSSVGLTLLHTTMCTGDAQTSRWIMHFHPELLNVEDSQRDTPLTIALKECSYFLCIYSTLNRGKLDDGTSYSDEDFFDHFPEVIELRNEIEENGEYIPKYGRSYVLRQNELTYLKEYGYFHDRPPTPPKVAKKKKGAVLIKRPKTPKPSKPLPSRRKKASAAGNQTSADMDADLYKRRFPEDDIYDDYEAGQMGSWQVLGCSVPSETIQINPFNKDELLKDDEIDLKTVVKSLQKIDTKVVNVVPKDDPFMDDLQNFDDGLFTGVGKAVKTKKNKKKKFNVIRMMHDVKDVMKSGFKGAYSLYSLVSGKSNTLKQSEVRYKMCQYAEILLSREIGKCVQTYHWNTDAYLDFNRLASKIQGDVAQQLAYVCNFGPPEGFARMSNWTKNGLPVEYDEYDGEIGDEHIKPIVDAFKAANQVGGYFRRGKNSRSGTLSRIDEDEEDSTGGVASRKPEFNDRIVSFLADCLVSCRERLDLTDSELSGPSRIGYRAVMRALRRRHCSFIVPGIFVSPRRIIIRHLELRQNELDCGDAILLADAMIQQQQVVLLDISSNRIGSRGMIALCKILKYHENIRTLRIDKNRIGPGAGKEIGTFLKTHDKLKVLSMANNRLGELVRYPIPQQRQRIDSAARDIFWGLKMNKNLEVLDLSYNQLGPKVAEILTNSIVKHPKLFSINLAGNNLGRQGAIMIWSIAGTGTNLNSIFEEASTSVADCMPLTDDAGGLGSTESIVDESSIQGNSPNRGRSLSLDEESSSLVEGTSSFAGLKQTQSLKSVSNKRRFVNLCHLGLADNQLGAPAGRAVKQLLKSNKRITALDLSGNHLGYEGGLALAEELESIYGVVARDAKKALYDEMTKNSFKRARKKKVIYTQLMTLNLRRNGLGPAVVSSIAQCLSEPNCTITELDVSDNPLFFTTEKSGQAGMAGVDIRKGIAENRTLVRLNLSNNGFLPPEVVPILGGFAKNSQLQRMNLSKTILDEPSCLQLANALITADNINTIELRDCKMGPKGGGLVLQMIEKICNRLTKVDISGNSIGSYCIIPLTRCIQQPGCRIATLDVSRNHLEKDGGVFLCKALINNGTITDLDLSQNSLTGEVAECISDALRGLFVNGRKQQDTIIKRIVMSDNPDIGPLGAKVMMLAVANDVTEHIEFSNIGGGPQMARIIEQYLRKVTVPWYHLDISNNNSFRGGLNPIFWSLRHNNRLRILKLANNKAGSVFGTVDDCVGSHGISICRALTENTLLTHVDLSYNNMSTEAGNNIIDSVRQNETIRHLYLAGNLFDDGLAEVLLDFLKENDIVMDLDLSHNKLGFNCGISISEGLVVNRAIKRLNIAHNRIASAGTVSSDCFYKMLRMNYSLRELIADGNRFGHHWGEKIAEGLARNSTLTKVDLRNTRISVEAGKSLVNVFAHNRHIMELAMSLDEIGDANFTRLRDIFQQKRALVHPLHDMQKETLLTAEHHGHKLKTYDHHNEQQEFEED